METKEKCHICLDNKLHINKLSSCKNDACFGYICSSCWYDLHINSIDICPLCREPINYTQIQKLFNVKNNIKNLIKNIIIYLVFYSMGASSIIAIKYFFKDIEITNNLEVLILSLIILPIIGFIIWYITILIIIKIYVVIVSFVNGHQYVDSGSDSDTDSDSDLEDNL